MRNRARVEVRQLRLAAGALAAVTALQTAQHAAAQSIIQVTDRVEITGSPVRAVSDEFGVSVSVSGTTAIVGAPGRDAVSVNSGAAYIYTHSVNGWGGQIELPQGSTNTLSRFGASVSIHGNVAVVGGPGRNVSAFARAGGAYVYRNSGGVWSAAQLLLPPSPAQNNSFGAAVATSGDLVVIGEPVGDKLDAPTLSNCGVVHVYRDTGGPTPTFVHEATLVATDPGGSDQFGAAIAVEGETIVVGAPFRDNAGAVYIFRNTGLPGSPAWSTNGPITPVQIASGHQFGFAVAMDGTRAIVGSPQPTIGAGAAYVIDAVTTSPVISTIPLTGDGMLNDNFGFTVSIWDTRALVGSHVSDIPDPNDANQTINQAGQVHVFNFSGGVWNEDAILRAADADDDDFFGYSVAAEQHAILGAFHDDDIRGAAYVYDLGPTTPPDSDADGLTDAEETLLGTNPNNADSDGDSLSDGAEVLVHNTNPLASDTDGDTLSDAAEINTHLTNPLAADTDADSLSDAAELNTHGTNPLTADSDLDGLDDGAEIAIGTDPIDEDTDDDGLFDGAEVSMTTNPFIPDTDGDGLTDGYEVSIAELGCPSPTNADSDGDGLGDGFENALFPALDPCDQDMDSDDDGLSNALEADFGTDPMNPDSDGDGLSDGAEVEAAGSGTCPSPLQGDSDGDTLSDGYEMTVLGTSPCNADTDGDGAGDAIDTTPTDPGVEPDIIEAWLEDSADVVISLDTDLFEGNNSQVRAVRQFITSLGLQAAANAVSRGRERVALVELQILRRRLDGDSSPPDWMAPSNEQQQLLDDIDLAIEWIQMGM